jgi:hypothetical protein
MVQFSLGIFTLLDFILTFLQRNFFQTLAIGFVMSIEGLIRLWKNS